MSTLALIGVYWFIIQRYRQTKCHDHRINRTCDNLCMERSFYL